MIDVPISEQIYIPSANAVKHRPNVVDFNGLRVDLDHAGKPGGGLWTSTYATHLEDGWYAWCRAESFGRIENATRAYVLTPRADAKIFTVATVECVDELIGRWGYARYPDQDFPSWSINWMKFVEDFDAIRVTNPYDWEIRHGRLLAMYSWDCESTWWGSWCFAEVEGSEVELPPFVATEND